mgnify:CR=1 FL=1|tara:strand:- start:420 stop:1073 length:654 start_codon:yes stop_codon:yes gene_type:complete
MIIKIKKKKQLQEVAAGFDGVENFVNITGINKITISKLSPKYWSIEFFKGEEWLAEFQLDLTKKNHCGYAMTHSEIGKPEESKFGPYGYDLLIELGTLLGFWVGPSNQPSGIKDKNPIKGKDAIFLWIYYDEKRNDLEKKEMPECRMKDKTRFNNVRTLNRFIKELEAEGKDPTMQRKSISAITKMYKKQPILLKQLLESELITFEAEDDVLNKLKN